MPAVRGTGPQIHELPGSPSFAGGDAGMGLVWDGSAWTKVNLATQAELDAVATVKWLSADKTKYASTDQSTGDGPLTDLGLSVAANEVVQVELNLLLDAASASADWKFDFTVPAAGVFYWGPHTHGAAPYWNTIAAASSPTVLLTTGTQATGGVVGIGGVFFRGIYKGGANAGTLTPRFAQNSSIGSDSKVLAGSCLVAHRKP